MEDPCGISAAEAEQANAAPAMCFGLDRTSDEAALAAFLHRFADQDLSAVLIPRLRDAEITQVIDLLSVLLRRHLSHEEYHALFLKG